MAQSYRGVLCAFFMLTIVPYGLSIKCWYCRSSDDPKCGDPMDNSTLPIKDCNREKEARGAGSSMCRKIRQKVNGEWLYIRDCAYSGEVGFQGDERLCVVQTGTDNIYTEHCTCNSKDGCNSSYMFTSKPELLVLLVVVPRFMLNIIA